jgi:hypothetical protein
LSPTQQALRNLVVELCLLLPAELRVLVELVLLPRLVKPLALALSGPDELITQGLRTFEVRCWLFAVLVLLLCCRFCSVPLFLFCSVALDFDLLSPRHKTPTQQPPKKQTQVWVDNLNPEYLEKALADVVEDVMSGLWALLRPSHASRQHALTAMTLLGKLGEW